MRGVLYLLRLPRTPSCLILQHLRSLLAARPTIVWPCVAVVRSDGPGLPCRQYGWGFRERQPPWCPMNCYIDDAMVNSLCLDPSNHQMRTSMIDLLP